MRTVKFEGIAEDLTAPNTPWIYYGVRMPIVGLFSLLYVHRRRPIAGLVCGGTGSSYAHALP